MFNDPGTKIKAVAMVWAVLMIIASVIIGFYFMIDVDGLIGFSIIAGGSLFGYLGGLGMSAFGELVEDTSEIKYYVREMKEKKTGAGDDDKSKKTDAALIDELPDL